MGHYDDLALHLHEEMSYEDGGYYKLLMSNMTYNTARKDPKFNEHCVDGYPQYEYVIFLYFTDSNGCHYLFPIELDDSLPLGHINTAKADGAKPTIHF